MLVYSIHVSQDSVATHLWRDGIFNDSFVANFPQRVAVKKNYESSLKIDRVIDLA